MSADVLVFSNKQRKESRQFYDILLPVYAVECEARPPIETDLDSYQEVVLKLLSIGLPPASIRNSINISAGMLDTVLSNLANIGYVEKQRNVGWVITESGTKYLNNEPTEDQLSKNSDFGYMFVSALRKDVLCYFHLGPIDKIQVRRVDSHDLLLGRNGSEQETFSGISTSSRALGRVYAAWCRLNGELNKAGKTNKEEVVEETKIIAEQFFGELDSYDEVEDIPLPEISSDSEGIEFWEEPEEKSSRRYIRKLETPPKRYYISLRLICDPSKLNGYDVESPFESLMGIDSPQFLRQIQWMRNNEDITIGDSVLREFLDTECVKFGASVPLKEKDVSIHMLQVIPRLKYNKERFPDLYQIYPDLYALQQHASSILDKEGVVTQYCTKLIEPLFNRMFTTIPSNVLHRVKGQVSREDRAGEGDQVCQRIEEAAGISFFELSLSVGMIMTAINRLERTHGNSSLEKAINLLTLHAYAPSNAIRRYVEAEGLTNHLRDVIRLNDIRRAVSHDTEYRFSDQDYDRFMELVYPVADRLLASLIGG